MIRTMQDMKALISETAEKPIIADILMPPIKVTLSTQGLINEPPRADRRCFRDYWPASG